MAFELNGNAEEVMNKISRMHIMGVPDEQISAVIGCGIADVQEIKETDDYKKVYGGLVEEELAETFGQRASWDNIEAKACDHLLRHMNGFVDVDTAIKVATFANRANRRNFGGNQNQIPVPQQIGLTVINLQPGFVEALNSRDRAPRVIEHQEQKQQDFLDSRSVEKLLSFKPEPVG